MSKAFATIGFHFSFKANSGNECTCHTPKKMSEIAASPSPILTVYLEVIAVAARPISDLSDQNYLRPSRIPSPELPGPSSTFIHRKSTADVAKNITLWPMSEIPWPAQSFLNSVCRQSPVSFIRGTLFPLLCHAGRKSGPTRVPCDAELVAVRIFHNVKAAGAIVALFND